MVSRGLECYEWGMDEGKVLCGASVYIICVIGRNESGQALSMVLLRLTNMAMTTSYF
jgi:hypothetical protein